MSKFAERYNKGGNYTKSAPKGAKYYKLTQLQEKRVYPVDAIYINTKGRYGDEGVILSMGVLVNLPQHLTATVKEMRSDSELTDAINKGEFGFKVYKYEGANGSGYSVNWVDIDPNTKDQTSQTDVNKDDLPF